MNNEHMAKPNEKTIFGMILSLIGSSLFASLISLFVSIILISAISIFGGYSGDILIEKSNNFIDKYYIDYFITIISMVSLIFVYCLLMGKDNAKAIIKNFKGKKLWIYSILVGIGFVIVSFLYSLLTSLITDGSVNANQIEVINLIEGNYYLSFVYIVLLAPIVEELGLRYFVFGGIKNYNKKLAYFLGSGLFALLHFFVLIGESNINVLSEILAIPTYFGAGLLLCFAYDKSKKLSCPIIIHILNNLVSFLVVIL